MLPQPWLKQYPAGMPTDIYPPEYDSLNDLFERTVDRYREHPALSSMGATMTFAELEEKSRAFANYLAQDAQLGKGERVAVMLPNVLQYPVALIGILRAGLVVVNTNPLYARRELRHQLADAEVTAVVTLEQFAHSLEALLAEPGNKIRLVITTQAGDLLDFPKSHLVNFVARHLRHRTPESGIENSVSMLEVLAIGEEKRYWPPAVEPDDVAFLQYTGGTTGLSKGAMLTHANLLANIEQAKAWITHGNPSGKEIEPGRELVVTALPLYHIYALTANFWTFFSLGGQNRLVADPRDLPSMVDELRSLRFTCITGVNTLFNGLLKTPGFDKTDFSALKITLGGGMPTQKNTAERWQAVTGTPIIESYGLTEASPAVCINPVNQTVFTGSIGLPIPSTQVVVMDEHDRPLGAGVTGELCVRGPQVMKGYWNQPDETAAAFTADGWLRTGDIAQMDENGYFYIVDRKKDMVLISGFNVYPREVEAVINEHPGVLECGAVGVPDEETGEALEVFVVRRDPALTEQALRDYCRLNLTAYKRPKNITFTDALPKTPVGKILRRRLKELVN